MLFSVMERSHGLITLLNHHGASVIVALLDR
jgi:hypothetical protein